MKPSSFARLGIRSSWRRLVGGVCFAVGLWGAGGLPAFAESSLANVLQDGKIRVGVLETFKPFGFRDANGELAGLDVDLAKDTAERLRVQLELVPVTSANRMQLLQQGRIDVIIGAMGDTEERRKIVGMVTPHYFTSGPNVLAKAGVFKQWTDLKGQTTCAKQGLSYIRFVQQEIGAKMLTFGDLPEALQALRNGRCVSLLTDDFQVMTLLASGDWSGWEMPLPARENVGWSVGVPVEELDGPLGRTMAGLVYEWHAKGKLVELANKWNVNSNPWPQEMEKKLKDDLK